MGTNLKPYLLYYIHAHGEGHRTTFSLLYPALKQSFNIIAVTTSQEVTTSLQALKDLRIVELPPKWPAKSPPFEHTFSKAFEATPYAIEPAVRAGVLAGIIEQYRPVAFYCDGSPELAIMARGMGVQVVLVHLPGNITSDPTQVFAHELADHIVAHFPEKLERPHYAYQAKTFYSGFMSRYADRGHSKPHQDNSTVAIFLGFDNYDEAILQAITADGNREFVIIGNRRHYALGKHCQQLGRITDTATAIKGRAVITAAGQNTVAELISLGKRLILLPEPRPYDEQLTNAIALANNKLALLADNAFTTKDWTAIIERVHTFTPDYRGLINKTAPTDIAAKLREWYA